MTLVTRGAVGRANFLEIHGRKSLGQNLTRVVISGNSERISHGVIRSEVGRPEGLWLTPGGPASERITPGEFLSELPEINTPVRFWLKFLENHTAVKLQKISRGLLYRPLLNQAACDFEMTTDNLVSHRSK